MDNAEKAQDIKRHPQISETRHPEKNFGHCLAEPISVKEWPCQVFDKTELRKMSKFYYPKE